MKVIVIIVILGSTVNTPAVGTPCSNYEVEGDDQKYVEVTIVGNFTRQCATGTVFNQVLCACILGSSDVQGGCCDTVINDDK